MDKDEQERFRDAVNRKAAEAEEASKETSAKDNERQLIEDDRKQGHVDPRKTNTRHGQVTADKWNQ